MIRSCTRPAVSTDMKAAWLVVRPLPVQGVGRRPVRGDDSDRGSIPRTVRIRPVHSRWYGAGHYAFVAQWIGRPPPERKAAGSSPAEGTQGTPPVGREGRDGHRTHVAGSPRHPPCRGTASVCGWSQWRAVPVTSGPAGGVQRVGGRANRHIGGWCKWQHDGLWNRMLQVRVLPRLRTIHGCGHGPANSLSWSGSRDRSRRPSIRGWFSDRCFANTKLTRVGWIIADGLIAVRKGCSSMAEPLVDAGSSPAAPRAGLGAGSSRSY